MNKHSVYLNVAEVMARRATCPKREVGAIIVKNDRIIAAGFNGAPHGMKHCAEVGCDEDSEKHCRRALHAEENALLHAGVDRAMDAILYCTHFPCYRCAKMIIQCGINIVIYRNEFFENRVDRDALFEEGSVLVYREGSSFFPDDDFIKGYVRMRGQLR